VVKPDRTKPPKSGELKQPKFVSFNTGKLVSDNDLLEIPDSNHPITFVEFIFSGGRYVESIPGTSWFAAKMIAEGTTSLTSSEISTKIESLGSYLEISPGMDFISIKIYALRKNIATTVTILEELLLNSSFPEAEYALLKTIRAQNIWNQLSKNSSIASLEFNKNLFGNNHPYGRFLSPEEVEKIELDEVKKYFSEKLFNSPRVIVGGDYDASLLKQIQSLISKLPKIKKHTEGQEISQSEGKSTISKISSNQASLRIGALTLDKNSSEIHPLTISNTLLGGFFGSRLMKSIREEKGLTYGIYSQISHLKMASYWVISAEVEKNKVEEAVNEINKQIDLLSNTPPSFEELSVLRNYQIGKIQNSMDSLFSIIGMYKSLFLIDKTPEFLDSYWNSIMSIKPIDINSMVYKYIQRVDKTTVLLH